MTEQNQIAAKLQTPFHQKQVKFRVGATNKEKTSGQLLAYIEARDVMFRLDTVLGPENWSDEYQIVTLIVPMRDANRNPVNIQTTGVVCRLSLCIDSRWISKSDVGVTSDYESVKGAYSDAFKRAAVKWGIGRYLYYLESPWVPLDQYKRPTQIPELPAWALPKVKNEPT